MKLKTYILITAMLLASSICYADDMLVAINSALSKYCVPPDGHNCNPNEFATYNTDTEHCDCKQNGAIYFSKLRRCEKCEQNEYVTENGCTNCGDGVATCSQETGEVYTCLPGYMYVPVGEVRMSPIRNRGPYTVQKAFCEPCPAGYYCPDQNTKKDCPMGHYCSGKNVFPIECPRNQCAPGFNRTSCHDIVGPDMSIKLWYGWGWHTVTFWVNLKYLLEANRDFGCGHSTSDPYWIYQGGDPKPYKQKDCDYYRTTTNWYGIPTGSYEEHIHLATENEAIHFYPEPKQCMVIMQAFNTNEYSDGSVEHISSADTELLNSELSKQHPNYDLMFGPRDWNCIRLITGASNSRELDDSIYNQLISGNNEINGGLLAYQSSIFEDCYLNARNCFNSHVNIYYFLIAHYLPKLKYEGRC